MDVSQIATNLRLTGAGVWTSGSPERFIFPEGGECFHVEEGSFWFGLRQPFLSELAETDQEQAVAAITAF